MAKKPRAAARTTTPTDDFAVGRIAGVFGLRGELKCDPTQAGRIVFSAGARLTCGHGEQNATVRLASVRPHGARLLVRFEGVEDAGAAAEFAGSVLYAPRTSLDVAPDEYLDADLIGCSVQGGDGTEYGEVERVEHYPSSDMLVVGGKMVPMVRAIVISIDPHKKRIVIDPPEGLMD
ncbi:MAG TPA: ribosome maturation factor RimM [Candidatus Baltobacteraceae bacterium]|nr:ribosome maturation factor RimM [Candidatus Baltobacteraceae bacterium]